MVLKKSNKAGISGQSQVTKKAAKSFVARLKNIQAKQEDLAEQERQRRKKKKSKSYHQEMMEKDIEKFLYLTTYIEQY